MTVLLGTLDPVGGAADGFGDGDTFGTKYTAVASGSLDTLKIAQTASGYTGLKLAIYADSAGVPGALLGTSALITDTTTGTKTATVSPTVTVVSGTAYWLFLQSEGGDVNIVNVNPGNGYRGKALGAGTTTFPSTWNTTGDSVETAGIPIQGEAVGGGGGGGSAPANTVAPAVTGTAQQGQTLSCSQGTWSNTPTSYAYQWKRADAGTSISGATSSSYVLQAADVGHTIKCTVTATNATGSTSADSNTTATVSSSSASADIFVRVGGASVAVNKKVRVGGAWAST